MPEQFELLGKELGRGGFARTCRARVLDPELIHDFGTNEVALKIPLEGKERTLARELEVNAALHMRLKSLRSLNLVRYLGLAVFDQKIVMAMEFVKDGSLRDRIGKIGAQRPLPIPQALDIAVGILQGLAIIHQEHVFHRDIKPENILIDGDTPKIADLGIARMLETNELASTTTGTIFFMSPESLGEEGASFPSDIWSVGVTLYEMLTGKLPFGDPYTPIGKIVDLIRTTPQVPVAQVRREVPSAVSDVVDRALRKKPAERFHGAQEMIAALEAARRSSDDGVQKAIAAIRAASGLGSSEVEARLREVAAAHPRSALAHQALGEFYNGCQRYADAIAAFRKAIEQSGKEALLHWYLALAHRGLGQTAEAVRSLEQAIRLGLDPSLKRYADTLLTVLRAGRA